MQQYEELLKIAQCINDEIYKQGFHQENANNEKFDAYDIVVTNSKLRKKTEKLFRDGHHARAVEEAYKLIDNLVKNKAGLENTDLTGAKLMQNAFSANNPILKLNEGKSTSEKDEQIGYMQIFAGCMTGIRNPRAHETDWEDTEERALLLLAFADHLIERIVSSIAE